MTHTPKSSDENLRAALEQVEAHLADQVADLSAYVRIPSVSTQTERRADIDAAADWTAARLSRAGFPEVQVMPTAGYPVVVARWHVSPELPTVVFYGHYDVQPPEPLELWESPPFEPEVRDGKLFGRGASDDKGAVLSAVRAVEACARAAGKPPVNLTFLIEGEEEIGSPSLSAFLEANRELLAGDLAVSADGGIYGVGIPSLTVGTRGLVSAEIRVKGAAADLHSGSYGGAVANPIMALSRILASLQDPQGRILVDGFHEGVETVDPAVRSAIAQTPGDLAEELKTLELDDWWGDPDYTPLERRSVRPTFEVNGITGGYQGPGVKTVLPSEAVAKVTCRLAGAQDPWRVYAALERHVLAATPPGVTVTIKRGAGIARPYQMPVDLPILEIAGRSMTEVYGLDTFFEWSGGTVPVAEQFRSILGMWCLYFAFQEPDNQLHAPNEFFRLEAMRKGTEATVRLLHALAANPEAVLG